MAYESRGSDSSFYTDSDIRSSISQKDYEKDVEIGDEEFEPLVLHHVDLDDDDLHVTPPAYPPSLKHIYLGAAVLVAACALGFLVAPLLLRLGGPPVEGGGGTSVVEDMKFDVGWGGWDELEYLFVFGDSYSDQGFDPFKKQPHPGNPFGNPDWLMPLSSGSNWVHFAGLEYNNSYLRTYSLAVGGSTVDSALVTPFGDNPAASFTAQYASKFHPIYAHRPTELAPWKMRSTLFAVWFGINDIALSCGKEKHTIIKDVQKRYWEMLEELYQDGARNFLLLNVPPFYHNFLESGTQPGAELMLADTQEWNSRLSALRDAFIATHEDSTMFLFDTWTLYNDLLEDPASQPETEGLKILTGNCEAYAHGTFSLDELDAVCELPVNQWFWLNDMHPTYPVHRATTARIVEDCFGKEGRLGYCS